MKWFFSMLLGILMLTTAIGLKIFYFGSIPNEDDPTDLLLGVFGVAGAALAYVSFMFMAEG